MAMTASLATAEFLPSIVYPYRKGEPFPASPFFMFFFKEAHHDQASC
jgi:hypothetical protein